MKIGPQQKQLVKDGWPLFLYFWGCVAAVLGALYSWGFADIPATATSVKRTEAKIINVQTTVNDLGKTVQRLEQDAAVSKESARNVERRLETLDEGQQTIQRDIHQILQLMIQNRPPQ